MIRTLTSIAIATLALASAPSARADTTNEIRAVTYAEHGATTQIRVRGAHTPTFTVYKLDRPSRVVLDVPRAHLGSALRGHEAATVFTPSTWAVSTIAAQQLDDGGEIVRVIVTLARPGRYDVKTSGNEVVVSVIARDPMPAPAGQAELAKARAAATAAQAEAERLRKLAADAQRAADDARRAGSRVGSRELAKARADAARAKQAASAADARATQARADAEAARQVAARETAEADRNRGEAEAARRDAAQARQDADAARQAAKAAKQAAAREAEAARRAAQAAKQAATREAEAARRDAERTRAEAAAQAAAAAQQQDVAARAKAQAEQARREAEVARRDAARAKADAERARKEAAAIRAQADAARRDAAAKQAEAEQARKEAAARQAEADAARTDARASKDAVARSRAEADAARQEARQAKADAEAARAEADRAKQAAATDRQQAIRARAEADRMLALAKRQLADVNHKIQDAQQLEDRARATSAAAEAREQVAREQVAQARRAREAAEKAARLAKQRATSGRDADRRKLEQDARIAAQRLAEARRAADEADARRAAAEAAAGRAKQELAHSRTLLANVEHQRAAAQAAASDASRKRGEAEAAARDAARRRTEAERAVADASRQRAEAERAAKLAAERRGHAEQQRLIAETQRKAAEAAARAARRAADAAEHQRQVAERATRAATAAKRDAERGLAELTARRHAAEQAAADLEARSRAEATAQARVAAAQARGAADDLAKARAEVARLAAQRQRAERALAERRKAVVAQQAEASRLELRANSARDAASREEARRAQLAAQRVAEEHQLAKLRASHASAARPVRVAATPSRPATAPARTPRATRTTAAARVTDVSFRAADGNGEVIVALDGDAKVALGKVTPRHVELIVDHAVLAKARLERTLDVTRFGSPVRSVSSFRDRRHPDRVRLVAELAAPATPMLERDPNGAVRWRFVGTTPVARRAPRTRAVPPPVVGGFGATSTPLTQQSVAQVPPSPTPRRRIYRGATVDFDFKDAPIADLLRVISDVGRVNILVPDTITARVTVRLKRVPWDQAFEAILASHGLWYRREGNIIRVADRKELDKEDQEAAARAEAARKAETPRPEVIRLNYASAAELKPKLQGMVSPSGSLEVDERQNALIINDVSGNRQQIAQLALSLDRQTPQISIEARIVEARSTFLRQIGVQWGGRALASAATGNSTGLLFPNSISVVGGNEDNQTVRGGVAAPSDFAVNLPAGTGSGEGGALGMSLGSIGGNFAINLRLSALEDTGTIRIISAPKITVLNNKPAKIAQGVQIPIQVISAAGTQTQLIRADLSLEVTPYVSPRDCAVQMKLLVTKNEPDFVNVGARGDPSFLTKEASTTMLVNDGDTSVLGGIYTRNSGLAYKKIPFFGDLPVIGWLFKNRRENDDRTEILVFITPKITNKAALNCGQ